MSDVCVPGKLQCDEVGPVWMRVGVRTGSFNTWKKEGICGDIRAGACWRVSRGAYMRCDEDTVSRGRRQEGDRNM